MVDYKSAYFFVPASFMIRNNCMKIQVSEVDQTLILEGNLDPDKHYEIVELFEPIGDHEVGEIFTGISANVSGKGIVKLFSSDYPMKNKTFQAFEVATTDSGKIIIHLALEKRWIKEYKRFTRQDSLTDLQAKKKAKIDKAFIGFSKEDVFAAYPELEPVNTGEQDENGNDIIIKRFRETSWSFDKEI